MTPLAFCEVMAQLKAKAGSVTRIPETVDLHGELRKAAERFPEKATAHRWVGPGRPLPKGIRRLACARSGA